MHIIHARNPALAQEPQFLSFLGKVFKESPWEVGSILEHLENLLTLSRYSLLLCLHEGEYLGLALVAWPGSDLDPNPQVVHFYAARAARKALVQATVDFIRARGYNRFLAVNYTGKPDRVWERAMRAKGWTTRPVGSIMEFKAQ